MMTDKQRYQLERRSEPVGIQLWGVGDGQPEGSNGGFLLAGQGYTAEDTVAVHRWMYERRYAVPQKGDDYDDG